MAINYIDIPDLNVWKRDSSVALATRANDAVLTRIDDLLDAYNRAPDDGVRIYVLCDLFFTLDYWLKVYENTPKMEKGREPAVMALYKTTVDRLGHSFGAYYGASGGFITPNNLPTALELFFGRTLSAHGAKLDQRFDCAQYLSRAEVAKYRLSFKNGKVYQFPWWQKKAKSSAIVLADSKFAYEPAVFLGAGRVNWGGFAMSMGRDIYMAKHHCTHDFGENGNFYHSSYLSGEAVMCAGTMLIENGVIKALSTDSGHYQPDNTHVVNLLQTLAMHGVNITTIDVQDYQGIVQSKGDVFLSSNGNWASMFKREQLNLTHMDAYRVQEKAFGDSIKKIWLQGLAAGFYTDDAPGKIYFASHVLPKRYNLSGMNFLYALDALAKAISRSTDPVNDWNAWCIDQWRTYLKQQGATNSPTNIRAFAGWLHTNQPSVQAWSQDQLATWVEDVFKRTGHQFG